MSAYISKLVHLDQQVRTSFAPCAAVTSALAYHASQNPVEFGGVPGLIFTYELVRVVSSGRRVLREQTADLYRACRNLLIRYSAFSCPARC